MGKYLTNFKTKEEYEAFRGGDQYVTPNVSFIETAGSVINDSYQVPGGSTGGGSELEGEYFLAKPNGRYWKSKLARMERGRYPAVMSKKSEFTDAQLEALAMCCELFSHCAFSAIGDYGGMPISGSEILNYGPTLVVSRFEEDATSISDANVTYLSLLGAWQEADFTMLIPGEGGFQLNGIVGILRLMGQGEFDDMSDDEVLTLASEMLMIEQVTKEEYESWYKW